MRNSNRKQQSSGLKDPLYDGSNDSSAPAVTAGSNPKSKSKPSVETAGRNANNVVDVCPLCGKQMKKLLAAGIPSYTCFEHRVTMPAITG